MFFSIGLFEFFNTTDNVVFTHQSITHFHSFSPILQHFLQRPNLRQSNSVSQLGKLSAVFYKGCLER